MSRLHFHNLLRAAILIQVGLDARPYDLAPMFPAAQQADDAAGDALAPLPNASSWFSNSGGVHSGAPASDGGGWIAGTLRGLDSLRCALANPSNFSLRCALANLQVQQLYVQKIQAQQF